MLRLHNKSLAANNRAGIGFTEGTLGSGAVVAGIAAIFTDHNTLSRDADLVFLTTSSNVYNQKMILNNKGNLGIGISSPTNKLQVYSSTTAQRYAGQFHNEAVDGPINILGAVLGYSDAASAAGVSKYGGIFQAFNGAGINTGVKGEASAGTGTNIGGYFNATAGTNNYAAIFENGDVGFGTTAPLAKIHIESGHLKSTQTVAPTIVTVLGGGLTHSLNIGSTDIKGVVATAGTLAPSNTSTFRVTFNVLYNIIPVVVATVAGSDPNNPQLGISVDAVSTADFTISIRNNAGGGISNPRINYIVIE